MNYRQSNPTVSDNNSVYSSLDSDSSLSRSLYSPHIIHPVNSIHHSNIYCFQPQSTPQAQPHPQPSVLSPLPSIDFNNNIHDRQPAHSINHSNSNSEYLLQTTAPPSPPRLNTQPSVSINDSVVSYSMRASPLSLSRAPSQLEFLEDHSHYPYHNYNNNNTVDQSFLSPHYQSQQQQQQNHSLSEGGSDSYNRSILYDRDNPINSHSIPTMNQCSAESLILAEAVLPPPSLRLQRQSAYYRQNTSPSPSVPTLAQMRISLSAPLRNRNIII